MYRGVGVHFADENEIIWSHYGFKWLSDAVLIQNAFIEHLNTGDRKEDRSNPLNPSESATALIICFSVALILFLV